jgi:DNA polymerase-3 subunit epsilon/ATP-dependent DNA helicase DinG
MATVESPFDYKRSTLLYLPSDMPLPNQPNYQRMVEQAIVEAATAADGRTLVLFTSYQQLRTSADAIRAPLDRLGITVLAHGQSGRQRLLREYRKAPNAVLLGTRSFWEGIDLPGDELRCLLIARLPFAVPNDPLVAARSAEFEDPFQDYTVPDAVLRFRQGFGRLIRRATDRGVVVLLDSRVWRKDYGQTFLESLPECTQRRAPLGNLGSEIRTWLGKRRDGQQR